MASDVHYFSPTTPGAASFDEDVSAVVRRGRIGPLSCEAQMGAVGSGSQKLDDIDSTLGHLSDGILGLKQWYWNETTCPAGNRRVYTGYTFDRNYTRGDSLVTEVARQVDVTLMDTNAFLSFRIFAPEADDPTSSFDRPAEDSIVRIQALLNDVDFLSTTLFDLGYIPTVGGKDMDAHSYEGAKPYDVLNDIAQFMQWNFWVDYDETENKLFLWMDDWKTDGSATVAYDSTVKLTNVHSERSSTVFLAEPWPVENIDPSRVISAVRVMGKGVNVYRTQPTTAEIFGWRDAVYQAQYLSDVAKLTDLADTYLLENSTEDHKITCTVQIPAASVTTIKQGMRLQVHFTHCPSVAAGFTWTRVMHRTVRRDLETSEFYWLDLELSPIPAAVEPAAVLYRAKTDDDFPAYLAAANPLAGTGLFPIAWMGSGDTPGATYDPTVGPLHTNPGSISDPHTPPSDGPYTGWLGWTFEGAGTIDIDGDFQVFGALDGVAQYVELLLDGAVIATGTGTSGVPTPTNGCLIQITETGLAVTNGSVLTGRYYHAGTGAFYIDTPGGDPEGSQLRITGGSLMPV